MKRFTAVLLSLMFLVGTGVAMADVTPKAPKHHHTKKHHQKKDKGGPTTNSAPSPSH